MHRQGSGFVLGVKAFFQSRNPIVDSFNVSGLGVVTSGQPRQQYYQYRHHHFNFPFFLININRETLMRTPKAFLFRKVYLGLYSLT